MNTYTAINLPVTQFNPDKKGPLRFTWISMIAIYCLQYPLSFSRYQISYGLEEWLTACTFVFISILVFIASLYIGLSGKSTLIHSISQPKSKPKKLGIFLVLIIFAVLFFWSYLMLKLKIGMTMYVDFDPLPFRITGLLFYGRLFIHPIVLVYVANAYVDSKLKYLIFLLLIVIGAWASLTSGSRFIAVMFALPVFSLFSGKLKYIAFAIILLGFIIIATLSRCFYLPFQIGGEYIEIYANEESQAIMLSSILIFPFEYIVSRTMGMAEVLMTLNFGAITTSFSDSLIAFFSYFLSFVSKGNSVSIKNIYGMEDDAFGGYGLDMFSNYWIFFGGNLLLYGIGLALVGWMLGKTQRLFSIILARFGMKEGSMIIFILLFMLIFEGRGHLFPSLLLIAWFFSRNSVIQFVFSLLKLFSKRSISSLQSFFAV